MYIVRWLTSVVVDTLSKLQIPLNSFIVAVELLNRFMVQLFQWSTLFSNHFSHQISPPPRPAILGQIDSHLEDIITAVAFCCCEATFAHIIFGLFFYLPPLKHSLDKDLCYARDHINALSLSLVALCRLVSGRMVTMCVQMLLSYLSFGGKMGGIFPWNENSFGLSQQKWMVACPLFLLVSNILGGWQ